MTIFACNHQCCQTKK